MEMSIGAKKWVALLLVVTVLVAIVFIQTRTDYGLQLNKIVQQLQNEHVVTYTACDTGSEQHYIDQRNRLSRELNQMKKSYGQQSCNMNKLTAKAAGKASGGVSENGGWCAELSGADSPAHKFDEGFAKALSKFLKGKVVASFGDGPGLYKKRLTELKEVTSYTAYDGAPFCETTTEGRVNFLDLTAPQYDLPAFDWVVSVEVGEHIPKQFQDVFMDNLVRHAKEGIILSWAVLGQGGTSHVNNRALEDVVNSMERMHFTINKTAGAPLRSAAAYPWLRNNVHVYRRLNPSTFKPKDT